MDFPFGLWDETKNSPDFQAKFSYADLLALNLSQLFNSLTISKSCQSTLFVRRQAN